MAIAYLCLGSNSGDRFKLIEQAVSLLSLAQDIDIVRSSALYETEPWGLKEQNWFLNLAVEVKTSLKPDDLLRKCLEIEKILGRDRENGVKWGERTVDIDIIFYGKETVNTENLSIPHKYMHKRAFVLVPLLELIPDFVHPVMNKSVSKIYDELDDVEDVYLWGTKING